MKVSPEARHLAKYKEKKKEISVATLQFDVTFCTPILYAASVRIFSTIKQRDVAIITSFIKTTFTVVNGLNIFNYICSIIVNHSFFVIS